MKDKDFVTITNVDIYKKLESSLEVQAEILDHAKYTNGKIAQALKDIEEIKKRSIGNWIATYPARFIIMVLLSFSLLTQDYRDTIINIFKKLI